MQTVIDPVALLISWFPAGGKAPIAVLGAENDNISPPALLKQFEEILASKPEVRCFCNSTVLSLSIGNS